MQELTKAFLLLGGHYQVSRNRDGLRRVSFGLTVVQIWNDCASHDDCEHPDNDNHTSGHCHTNHSLWADYNRNAKLWLEPSNSCDGRLLALSREPRGRQEENGVLEQQVLEKGNVELRHAIHRQITSRSITEMCDESCHQERTWSQGSLVICRAARRVPAFALTRYCKRLLGRCSRRSALEVCAFDIPTLSSLCFCSSKRVSVASPSAAKSRDHLE